MMNKTTQNLKRVVVMPFLRFVKKWTDQLYFFALSGKATPTLILQMGKVGSTSIYWSLMRQYRGAVLYAHKLRNDDKDPTIRRLHKWAVVNKKPLNVISLTREPISRNIASFFQNFERDTGVPFIKSSFSNDELKHFFLANFPHELSLQWFDEQIRGNFGIDVYATPFPEKGIAEYSYENIRLLVMRLETPDDQKAEAINKFLGLGSFKLYRYNIGEKKDYSSAYRSFKSWLKLPREYVDKICESRYFKHFYNADTIQHTRDKWTES